MNTDLIKYIAQARLGDQIISDTKDRGLDPGIDQMCPISLETISRDSGLIRLLLLLT